MNPVGRFTLKVFPWLPICFGIWYFSSILFAVPLAAAIDTLMRLLFPDLIQDVARGGNALIVVTRLEMTQTQGGTLAIGDILFKINPLKYGYGVPLYTALVLAVPGDDGEKILRWILGILILFLIQVFGVSAEVIKILAFDINAESRERLGFSAHGYEALALAYQFGFLILPSVSPLVIWVGQFRHPISTLIQAPTKASG